MKDIKIGYYIKLRVQELKMDSNRICNYFKCTEEDLISMYSKISLDTQIVLKWSKLLKYDFFRLYSNHLILYSPPGKGYHTDTLPLKVQLPQFRKNLYTKEIIDFILERITTGHKTRSEIVEEYKIPRSTLYKWIKKYS